VESESESLEKNALGRVVREGFVGRRGLRKGRGLIERVLGIREWRW